MKPENWWTDERVAELKVRWANCESSTIIANAMRARSRDAVIGKLHRLGLRRVGPGLGQRRQRAPRKTNGHKTIHYVDGRVFIAMGETMIEEPPVFDDPKPFIALRDGDCRWPGAGDSGPDLPCCAAPALAGKPYCLAHCRIAYIKPGTRPR